MTRLTVLAVLAAAALAAFVQSMLFETSMGDIGIMLTITSVLAVVALAAAALPALRAARVSPSVTLQAVLTPAAGGSPDLTKAAPPIFLLYKSTNLSMSTPDQTCTATSLNSAGVASCASCLVSAPWRKLSPSPP